MTDSTDEGLPRAVAIAWGMVADPQRGPKRELSHERIVEAAIEIADTDGLAAVTMSRVAAALGFTTMALYRYVTAKDELLQLMQEAAIGEQLTAADPEPMSTSSEEQTEGVGWARELHRIADQIASMYRDHPWMTEIPVSTDQLLTPSNLLLVDQAARAMRELPITDHEKIGVLLLVSTYVRSSAEMLRDVGSGAERLTPAAAERRMEMIKEMVTAERFPYLRPMVESGTYLLGAAVTPADGADGERAADDPADQPGGYDLDDYEFGLQLIFAGIARYAADHEPIGRPVSQPGVKSDDQLAEAMGLDHVRKDTKVRAAVKARRELESKLREARKREREVIKAALDRGPK